MNDLSRCILRTLKEDFLSKRLKAADLRYDYEGMSLQDLKERCCGNHLGAEVDYDLAFTDLEEDQFVTTGPMKPVDNNPYSSIVVIGLWSRREYARLTEKGYKAA